MGEMLPALQSKLLRFLEEKSFRRVGGTADIRVDVRVIAATNRNLEEQVRSGKFREDLYYRLNVLRVEVPPLRERLEDLPLLAQHFTDMFAREFKRPVKGLSVPAEGALRAYRWPGNVRELRNLIERTLILGRFPEGFAAEGVADVEPAEGSLAEVERRHILSVLRAAGGNRDEAARRLGISRKTVDRKVAAWNG